MASCSTPCRRLRTVLLVTLALLTGGVHAEPPASEPPELLLVTGEWPPYTSASMPDGGCLTPIVAEAARRMGYRPRIDFYPWRRAEAAVREGTAFAAFPYASSPERERSFNFSDPLWITRTVFFYDREHYRGPMRWRSLEDLAALRLGGLLGSYYEPALRGSGLAVEYVNSDEQNFRKLHAGRLDLVPTDELQGWWMIEKLFPRQRDNFETLIPAYQSAPSRLMISRGYAQEKTLTLAFNNALSQLQASGFIAQTMAACIARGPTAPQSPPIVPLVTEP